MNRQIPSKQVLVCPQCGGTMDEYFVGEDRRAVCQYCRSKIDLPEIEQPLATTPIPIASPDKNNTLSTVSLVAGILGLLNFFPILGSLVAILAGREALKKIAQEPELYTGEKNARLGMTLGWIGLAMMAIFFCLMIVVNAFQFLLALLQQPR